MSIFSKIVTAIRGGANEMGEAVVDANAIRILDQETRDAKEEIRKAEQGLASLIADLEQARSKHGELSKKISEHETYAMQALDKGDESLATDIAERIAEFEEEAAYQHSIVTDLEEKIGNQRTFLKEARRKVEKLSREARMVHSTEQVQKTTMALSSSLNSSDSKVGRAVDSLQRIKERQERRAAEAKAAEQLAREKTGADLEDRMKAAGITENGGASDVLARLKASR